MAENYSHAQRSSTSGELFVVSIFIQLIFAALQLVLFMDSYYSSLENYDFIKQAYDDNIHLVSIPPRIATLKLPLGLTVMGVLKDKWYEELDELQLAATASNPVSG